jgi:signal transduction histidine kinase
MINFFNRLRQSTQIIIALVMIAAIAMLDYATGTELTFSIFYFLPIVLVSWYVDRWFGLFFAFVCAIAWAAAEYLGEAERLNIFIFIFNVGVRLGIFITIALLISRLRRNSDRLLAERERKQILMENFVSLVKHELRNALSTGKLLLENLAHEKLTKKQLTLIRDIGEENDRVEETISTLSLLAHTDGAEGAASEPIELNELICTMIGRFNADKKVAIRCAATGAYTVSCPKSIVVHVVENVLSNAIKYSREEGTVEVKLREEDSGVTFSCRDAGIGIPEGELPYLFNPFFRGSNTRHVRGTGVGLYVAKELLDRIGGRIEVRSVAGEGTEVTVFFPQKEAAR